MSRRLLRTVSVAAAAALMLAGCGPREGGGDQPADGPGQSAGDMQEGMVNVNENPGDPVDGGVLTWASYTEPRLLDPAATIATATSGGNELLAIYDSLLKYNWETQKIEPRMAESFEMNDDNTELTLTLRDGVTFSDGTPLDAKAVKASMDRYGNSKTAPDGALWNSSVAEVKAVDDKTVVITLTGPYPTFVNLLTSGPGMIVAPDVGAGEDFKPIGAGPFTVTAIKPREVTEMAANENYWGGKPHLDGLRFVYLGNPQNGVDALLAGDVDGAMLREPHRIKPVKEKGLEGYQNLVAASFVLMFNTSEGRPGQDPNVRQSIARAVDPKLAYQRSFEAEYGATNVLLPEYSRWHSDASTGIELNTDEATQLLDEAKKAGFSGSIGYVGTTEGVALATKANLEAIGYTVDLDIKRNPTDAYAIGLARDFDILALAVNIREFDPYPKLNAVMHSKGTQTYGMATDPEMDALLDELKAATPEEQKDVMAKIEAKYYELMPFVSLGPLTELNAWQPTVHGVEGGANSLVNFDKAWIEKG